MAADNRPPPAKGWVFTLNNPEPQDEVREALLALAEDDGPAEYIVFQLERGAEGTLHFQGYVAWKNKKRFDPVRELLGGRAHVEKRKGSAAQAIAYCTKAETRVDGPWEAGKCPVAGRARELGIVQRKLDDGASLRVIAQQHFGTFLHYNRGLREYIQLQRPQRNWQTTVTVYWGKPGLGKSRRALHEAGPYAFWVARPAGQTCWFDGYDGEETIVIDEFYGWIGRDQMQRMIDRYPLNLEVKGSSVPFLAKHIIITSNQKPADWWRIGLGAMERRLTQPIGLVVEITEPWVPPDEQLPPLVAMDDEVFEVAAPPFIGPIGPPRVMLRPPPIEVPPVRRYDHWVNPIIPLGPLLSPRTEEYNEAADDADLADLLCREEW